MMGRNDGSKWSSVMNKFVAAVVLACVAFGATACNTVKGLGRDIESVGRTGEDVIKGK